MLFILLIIIIHTLLSHAIIIHEPKSRRAIISNTVSSLATLTYSTNEAKANVPQGERVVLPGTTLNAPLRNVVLSEDDRTTVSSWKPQTLITQLGKSRIDATELSPLTPSLVPFAVDNELFYDPFLFGTWDVVSTLKRKIYPYGIQYLPSNSLYEGSPRNRNEKPGDKTQYEMRFFSSSNKNVVKSNLNNDRNDINKDYEVPINIDLDQSISDLKIIADRSFNAKSLNFAYKQLSQVEDVIWDYTKDPTRLTLQFGTLGEDMQPLGERRGEVYINSRRSEVGTDPNTNEAIFCAAERLRSVVLVPGDVIVSDTETITEYRVIDGSDGNHVKAMSRIAVYLTPNPNSREGLLWQNVGGKAVAFFDYDVDLRRKLSNSRPFVTSSKGFSQVG